MHEYDTVLKRLLTTPGGRFWERLLEDPVLRWLPVELPKVQNPRVDLLGDTADGRLVQIEFQSTNDADMPLRMAEYYYAIYRRYRQFPRQLVLYVGFEPLRMKRELNGVNSSFRYELVDIRTLDGELLLASSETSDNVISILTNPQNERRAIERVIQRVGEAVEDQRVSYLQALLTLAGLRGLEELVEEEARKVPILNDILDNKVLGREYKRGMQEGRPGALEEGRQEGKLTLLRRQLEERFGPLPPSFEARLSQKSPAELETIGIRLLKVQSLDDLLG